MQRLKGHFCGILEGRYAESNADSGCLNHKVSERNKDPISNRARDHSCDVLVKNLTGLGLSPENLHEAELKSDGLIYMVEGFSRQYITFVAFFLLIILMCLSRGKEQQVGQKEILKMYNLGERVHQGSWCLQSSHLLKEAIIVRDQHCEREASALGGNHSRTVWGGEG